jgi:DNA-directed RNA polymerase subunit RPC12/RpoP
MELAAKEMERAMQGPIVSSRTSDTALPSFSKIFGGLIPFTPLAALTPVSSPKTTYRCEVCGQDFPSMNSLIHHMKTDHLQPGSKTMYRCTLCGTKIILISSLDRHMKTSHRL